MKRAPVYFLIVVVTCGLMWMISNLPNKGKLVKPIPEVKPTIIEELEYRQGNFTFKYPSKYRIDEIEKNKNMLVNIHLTGGLGVMSEFQITLKENVMSWDEVSGVEMRRIKNDKYTEIETDKGIMFVGREPNEKTFFGLKNGKALTVAMVVYGSELERYQNDWKKIFDSVVW